MGNGLPKKQGLYNPENEHDNCGIGFVTQIKGVKSHDIVQKGLEVLVNMTHRGAESADNVSGDGAGILIQVPHDYILSKGVNVPNPGKYGTGLIFLPQNEKDRKACEKILIDTIVGEGLDVIEFHDVTVDNHVLGDISRETEPYVKQIYVTSNQPMEQQFLERKLYMVRKMSEQKVRLSKIKSREAFYIPSLSSKVMIYKGMLTPEQVGQYFVDLRSEKLTSAIALVHSRFSTNTFPTWDLAQPFRMLAHNGEINTVKGNRNWMHAREGLMKSELFGDDLQKLFPVIEPDKSDSASLDNALEFLVMTGRSLPHALSMLIPESWNDKNPIPQSLKAFYEYHSTFMEPWDGPASIVFSDGRFIGGTLDRNGLRPSRYIVTNDDMIVMGSEVGVQSFEGKNIKEKGRLRPGKILLVDTKLGIIVPDYDVKQQLTNRQPYFNWLKENRVDLDDIVVKERVPSSLGEDYDKFLKVFGYAKEDLEMLIKPMAIDGQEPVSSMGNDTPLAVMSGKPQRLFNYFKQLFAQVTNPAIDPIREGLVMALTNYIGSVSKNILVESSDHCKLIKFKSPVVTNTDLQKIKDFKPDFFTHETIQMVFDPAGGGKSLEMALEQISEQAEKAVDNNVNYIILSDRNISKDMAPIPSLLATAAIHHHLIKAKKRMQVGLIVETADAREVTHFALLIGFGASVVNPYMAFAVIDDLCKSGEIQLEYGDARQNFIKSVNKGLLKILSKYGISTLRSYHGAQIFECLGINPSVVDKYFTGTDSRIGGIGLEEIAKEAAIPHKIAYDDSNKAQKNLKTTGFYHYRKDGETHAWNPETVGLLQWATRANDYAKYKEFAAISDGYVKTPIYLRGCLNFKNGKSIPIEEVEPAENIMKRFVTGAMSFGSISKEAHESLAIAMNTIGGKSNTGEGGEDPERFKMRADGTLARSAIKQVASGRFGVTTNYLVNADEIQIKVAQGAKPGEGGQLPGHKVDKIIAKIRNSTPGITLISPPPHHDIYSIEDLAQLIFDLKCSNPKAKINVKLVAAKGVGTIAAGVAKAYADSITIAGTEGGTGASPASSIKHAGLPMELGIAETQQTLVMNNLRDRVVLQTDGQMKTGRDVVVAGMLGAEEFGFATAALITLGCIMMRKCHLNTCPVGVATQNTELRKRFTGKHEYVINYFRFVAEEIREHLAELGYKKFDDIIGRADLLETRKDVDHWKAKLVDLSNLTYVPKEATKNPIHCVCLQKHKISDVMDHELIKLSNRAIKNKEKVWISKNITNVDRTVGATLSGEIAKVYAEEGLPENTINCKFTGSAGQSFGAFLVRGVTFTLIGESNDYLGKGLSGGRIIVSPPKDAAYVPEENIIIGNTVLYGATGGELYVRGVAGERFCVRNSGAVAVIEGVGDHCCEYMTGGRTVVLGQTGRNFAAGMSGGIAYVLDMEGNFDYYCNQGLVELGPVGDRDDINELQYLISSHYNYTGSELAERILTSWEEYLPRFIKVIPFEYKKVLEEMKLENIKNKIKHTEDEPHFHY
ncbi:MAG: glutamate synthase large subunit [Bacteroidetes bacterium]|jgi:glutamate synthase (NADPH/NADH) large chain|nr:glutamate synthase large subunit [Bacteroidota bacterium]